MLSLTNLTLRRGSHPLLNEASLTIQSGYKVGLIGKNGSGKSSLFALFLGLLEAETGELHLNKHIKVAHLKQETPALERTAIDYVIDGDIYFRKLQKQQENESLTDEQLFKLHEELERIDAFTIEARAAKILAGLGFQQHQLSQPTKSFSGGWRMRLNLAQCLITPSYY